tara:strand:- start:92 stop:1057 length:966 start_codon:yes stop_codon:yes gene_type:complete
MKIIPVFVVWVFAALSLKAQGKWIVENLDPITNLRTGVIRVNGNDYRIEAGANLAGANLAGADLSRAYLWEADLSGANLRGADLSGASLINCKLLGADLTEVEGYQVNFYTTDINGANFSGANLTEAVLTGEYDGTLLTGFTKGNYEEIQTLKTSDTTNTAAIATNTSEIEAIQAQLALLADALAAKDAEIEDKNERIAQLEDAKDERIAFLEDAKVVDVVRNLLDEKDDEIAILEQRPTQTEFDAVVTERDARPTPEEIQDARTGSVILTPSENGTVKLKLEIEESADLEVWSNEGKKLEALIPLAEGKKFLRFALAAQD